MSDGKRHPTAKRAVAGYLGAVIAIAMVVGGMILTGFGIMLSYLSYFMIFGLAMLVPGILMIVGGVLLFRKALWF